MTVSNDTAGYSARQAATHKESNADFPLRWHPRGGWCKKIKGKVYYWGRVTPEVALERYLHERDYLTRGEVPPAYDSASATLRDLCNEFLAAKEALLESGELAQCSFDDYRRTCSYIVSHFGANRAIANIRPVDFTDFRRFLAKGRGVVAVRNEVNRCRCVFKFAYDSELISAPIRYGKNFNRPGKGKLRKHRNEVGRQDFQPEEVKQLLDAAQGQLRAMILLGVNCGLGNADCGRVKIEAFDLKNGWLTYHREKTGATRRAPLWPETVAALALVIGDRRAGQVFRTKYLNPWATTAITHGFGKLLAEFGLVKKQRSFYGLRRTFRTIADECGDAPACNLIMGHTDDKTMGDLYVQKISDERLRKVSDFVRAKVLGSSLPSKGRDL